MERDLVRCQAETVLEVLRSAALVESPDSSIVILPLQGTH